MRFIQPTEIVGIEYRPFGRWQNTDEQGAFIVAAPGPGAFFCMLVKTEGGQAAPQVAFDRGEGTFDEASAVFLNALPFGFYHLPAAVLGTARRIRIRMGDAQLRYRCVMFETAAAVPVAALHFLFNLRYQNVKALAGGSDRGRVAALGDNVRRIRKYFGSVAGGNSLHEQQLQGDELRRIVHAQTVQSAPVRVEMDRRWASRSGQPLISFVTPVFETPPAFVRDLVSSFAEATADYAELILVDDGSTQVETRAALKEAAMTPGVHVVTLPANGGIAAATNAGLAVARGAWVSFIDHDDAFVAGAVAIIAKAIADFPDAMFFYTDELICDADLNVVGAFCKPAFDSVLLSGVNFINHFSVFRRDRLRAIGGLALDREGSQDYDLLLRYLRDDASGGALAGQVVHIPFLAYRWRRFADSYSTVHRDRAVANARGALASRYGEATSIEAAALLPDLHRVRLPHNHPRVSVVIPNRESLALIGRIVADLLEHTDYPDIEIIVCDNGSIDPAVLAFYEAHRGPRFIADVMMEPFNFSRACNRGARLASGNLLLFLNNDIEVIEPDWLAEMVECLSFPQTGIVGAKLLYPSGQLQHAGVICGLGEAAGHWFVNDPADTPGPMGRLAVRQTIGAVTGACMLVTRTCYEALGGFDETVFPIAYNDVDLCLRAATAGYRTVWTPFATLRHVESASRGSDETGRNRERQLGDIARLQARHDTRVFLDDAFSPFYDRRYSRPQLAAPPGLPAARPNRFV